MIDLSRSTQSGATCEIEIYRSDGRRLMILDRAESFLATRVISGVGEFIVSLPSDFPDYLMLPELNFWFWRKSKPGARKILMFSGVSKSFEIGAPPNAKKVMSGVSFDWLFQSRALTFAQPGSYTMVGEAQATQLYENAGDRLLRTLDYPVNYPVGYPYEPPFLGMARRSISYLPVSLYSPYRSAAPSESALAWFVALRDELETNGYSTFFEIIQTEPHSLEFRAYYKQPGRNLTIGNPGALVLDSEIGNFADGNYLEDYRTEANYLFAHQTGSDSITPVILNDSPYKEDRYASAPMAYTEAFVEQSLNSSLSGQAKTILFSRRGLRKLSGKIVNSAGCDYGLHWEFGDRINVEHVGRLFEAIIKAVTFGIDAQGNEILEAAVEITL